MDPRSQIARLAAIRAETDRQLLAILARELDEALTAVDDTSATGVCQDLPRAERAYTTAVLLLPTMRGLREKERRLLEQRVDELREGLERVLCAGRRVRGAGG